MLFTKKIKIWILITHGLILVGAGHGAAFLFMLPIASVIGLAGSELTSNDDVMLLTSLLIFVGQLCLLLSIKRREEFAKKILHVLGLILLWLSLIYLVFQSGNDRYVAIVWISVTPFAVCTVLTFFGDLFRKIYNRIIDG